MKDYKKLVKKALANNLSVSVFDGECWEIRKSQSYKDVVECIESVEEAQLRFRNPQGEVVGWALIIPELDDDECVADYSCDPENNWIETSLAA